MKKLKVLIDATPLLKSLTGVGYVTYIYSKELKERVEPTFFYVWFFSDSLRDRPLEGTQEGVNFVKKYIPRPYILTHSIKSLIFNIAIFFKQVDIVFQPNYNIFRTYKKIPTVVVVHDLSHIRYPEFHPRDRVDYFNRNLKFSIENSTKVVAISEFTKRELIDLNLAKEEQIEVIYNGVSKEFKPLSEHTQSDATFKKYNLESKGYILSVGTFEPRKNLNLLLRAYREYCKISKNPLELVLVGTVGWNEELFEDELRETLKLPTLKRVGYLSDRELKLVYAGAKIFVFPSFYEGFGLPVLEAMASEVAVISSNAASLPEVVADAGVLIDPNSESELLESIVKLDRDDRFREELEQRGLERVKSFNWEDSAQKLYTLFERVRES